MSTGSVSRRHEQPILSLSLSDLKDAEESQMEKPLADVRYLSYLKTKVGGALEPRAVRPACAA